MTLSGLLAICSVAIVGNWIVRRVERKINKEPNVADLLPLQSVLSNEEYCSLLSRYGRRATSEIPISHLSLDAEIIKFASEYAVVAFDEDSKLVFDRSLMATPFSENTAFVQIGHSGGEDPVLVKRHSLNSFVYRVDLDEGGVAQPQPYATSIQDYIVKEWLLEKLRGQA